MSEVIIPNLQIEKIKDYLKEGKRLDQRGLDEYREIKVEKDISKNAESAVSVKIGKTHVYCGVKMGIVEPYPDSKDEGTFMTTVELHPMASEDFEIGRPGINAVELARVIDRGIRESGFLDFKKMCIKEGEKVWQVFLDIIAINDDGNLFDAAGIAGLIALSNAKFPKYDPETFKIEHEFTDVFLPLKKEALSFNVTLHKIDDSIIVDPTKEEEAISDFRLSVAISDKDGEPRITALQKGKSGAITQKDFEKVIETIKKQHNLTFQKIKKLVWE
jgi:exosome complex component RRP42